MAMLTALFDACVLYPAPLRDLLMRLATTEVFRARWSEAIHNEWTRSVLEQRPELRTQLARTRQLMDTHVMDSLVTGHERLIDTLDLPDPDDRHVLAAAIAGGADVLVTKNLKDFPADRLAPFGIEAQHPDVFIRNLLRQHKDAMIAAVARHRAALRSPPKSADDYLETLLIQELPETVCDSAPPPRRDMNLVAFCTAVHQELVEIRPPRGSMMGRAPDRSAAAEVRRISREPAGLDDRGSIVACRADGDGW